MELEKQERKYLRNLPTKKLVDMYGAFSRGKETQVIAEYYRGELLSRLNQKGD